jgi:hypothetical protein
MKTIESLSVYWTFKDAASGEVYQDEVAGLVFYGYWSASHPLSISENVNKFNEVWHGVIETKLTAWEGEGSASFSIEVKINEWPCESEWISCIENSLKWFIENGADLSWCGGELCSSLLDVFRPDEGSGNVCIL